MECAVTPQKSATATVSTGLITSEVYGYGPPDTVPHLTSESDLTSVVQEHATELGEFAEQVGPEVSTGTTITVKVAVAPVEVSVMVNVPPAEPSVSVTVPAVLLV